jgi:hypothetical protein
MAQVLGEMQAVINKRLDVAVHAADDVASKLLALQQKSGPDADGIVRKPFFTPH